MKALIRAAIRLYPPAWRARYGAEFAIFMEDVGPSWRDFWNVLCGAIAMQFSAMNIGKLTAAVVAATALAAGIAEAAWPGWYQASTILRLNRTGFVKPRASTELKSRLPNGLPAAVNQVRDQVTSPAVLQALIVRYNLYPHDRRLGAGAMAAKMARDIAVTIVDPTEGDASVAVTFTYPDAEIARTVAWRLTDGVALNVETPDLILPPPPPRPKDLPKGRAWPRSWPPLMYERPRTIPPAESEPIRHYRFLIAAASLVAALAIWEVATRLRPRSATAPGPPDGSEVI